MADKQIRARVTEELSAKIDSVVDEINKKVPEANVNVSSILRYAVEEYLKRYDAKNADTAVFLGFPTTLPNEDLEELCKHFIAIRNIYQNVNHPVPGAFAKTIDTLVDTTLHLSAKSAQPNNDRVSYEKRMKELYKDAPIGE